MAIPDPLAAARQALMAGDTDAAIAACRVRTTAAPVETAPRYLLAAALAAAGDGVGATAALEEARMLDGLLLAGRLGADVARLSRDGDYAAQIGVQLYNVHHVAAAGVVLGRAIAAGHVSFPALLNLGLALQHQGRAEEAIRVFRATLELFPSAGVHQFLLYPHFMVEDGQARYAAEARAWAARWTPADGPPPAFASPPADGRPLRIGYVAPAFGALQVKQFITPVLEAHDPAAAEVFLYPAAATHEDGWPAHITVRPIGELSDVDACAQIGADGIDVLVDLWGHSAGSRLGVFARRAAPVQAGWINFIQTTGLATMDYVFHAASTQAPDPTLFTEQVWPLGQVAVLFRANADRPAPTPTPALLTGQVTFGSYNHPAKLSDATVRAWSRILSRSPGARLLLKYRYFVDPVLQNATRARFAAERVDADRIVFQGQSDGADYLAGFGEIDLALDPWPCPGTTTSFDALAMGVPMLALASDSLANLAAVGLPELVAETWDDYMDKAVALAADVPALAALRAKVRPSFDASPYRDEAGFTRRLEATFREMVARSQGRDARAVA